MGLSLGAQQAWLTLGDAQKAVHPLVLAGQPVRGSSPSQGSCLSGVSTEPSVPGHTGPLVSCLCHSFCEVWATAAPAAGLPREPRETRGGDRREPRWEGSEVLPAALALRSTPRAVKFGIYGLYFSYQ